MVKEIKSVEQAAKETGALLTTRSTGEPCYLVKGRILSYELCTEGPRIYAANITPEHLLCITLDARHWDTSFNQEYMDEWIVACMYALRNDEESLKTIDILKHAHANIFRALRSNQTVPVA